MELLAAPESGELRRKPEEIGDDDAAWVALELRGDAPMVLALFHQECDGTSTPEPRR
jgi:hypothetical protein